MRHAIACSAVLGGTALALAGCATPTQRAAGQGNLLAAAGFVQRPANTPRRQAEMAGLPPNRIVRTVHHDKVVYLYADPLVCDCLYIGNQHAWSEYQRELLRLQVSSQRLAAAQMNQNAAMQWAWRPWGPGWWR